MSVCPTQDARDAGRTLSRGRRHLRNQRSGRELVAELVFRPLAAPLVSVLAALRVPPPAVVLSNAAAGLVAAVALARGNLVPAALLLQVKTLLDNADGELARTSGRSSVLGRYLDTESDLLVNAALFLALTVATGAGALAGVALVALTFVLSADFNADVVYRRARGETVVTQPSPEGEGRSAHWLARLYELVFAPQDRMLQSASRRRLERLLARSSDPGQRRIAAAAYEDRVTLTVLANLGLSTQLAALGVCLVLGVPAVYVWLVLASAVLVPVLQLRRERLVRRALTM
jgi:archaetidylinositol phosphate synthase